LTDHLTAAEVDLYQRRSLSPEDLLRADDHIFECQACRARLASRIDAGKISRAWQAALINEPQPRFRLLAIAATVTLFAGAALMLRDKPEPRGLTLEQAQTVRTALRESKLNIPRWTAELAGRREVLMGQSDAEQSPLVYPVGTAVLEDRPTFRWKPMPGARGYTVILQNESSGQTLRSDRLAGTEWIPPQPLTRGGRYVWQLVVGETSLPKPPDPPARFYIVEHDVAQRLSRLPDSHLVRAVLYAEAGLMDAAESELEAELRQKPDSPVARTWLAALRQQKIPRLN
jgi:hypothetical protein